MMSVLLIAAVIGLLWRLYVCYKRVLLRRAELRDETLGYDIVPGDGGQSWKELLVSGHYDTSGCILGGSELSQHQVLALWLYGRHLLVDMQCQLCLKTLPEPGEPCSPRVSEPPPIPITEDDFEDPCYCTDDFTCSNC